jgi:hypothetical protein
MANLYHQLYNDRDENSLKQNYLGTTGNTKFIYSLGLESPANRVFAEYADGLNLSSIDPESEAAQGFFYNLKNVNGSQATLDLHLDQQTSPIFTKMASYFNQLAS